MEARRSAQCFAPEGGRDSTDTTDTASIMGADGGQSPGQNSTTARTATQRQPNAATPEIVALRGRAARSQRGNPGTGLTRVNARMELQGGRRMSLTKCSRGDVVEPNQSRPGTPKTPAKSQNLYASIGIRTPTPRMHSCMPHTQTRKVRLRRQRPRRLLGVEACGGRKRSKHQKWVRTLGSVTVRRTTPSKETAK